MGSGARRAALIPVLLLPFFEGNAVFLFEDRAVHGVIAAKRHDTPVWQAVVYAAPAYPIQVEVVGVHKVHGTKEERLVVEGRCIADRSVCQDTQDEISEIHTMRRLPIVYKFWRFAGEVRYDLSLVKLSTISQCIL